MRSRYDPISVALSQALEAMVTPTPDPKDPVTKKQIKASITEAVAREVVGSDRIDIASRVESLYERLLLGAVVFAHNVDLVRLQEVNHQRRGVHPDVS